MKLEEFLQHVKLKDNYLFKYETGEGLEIFEMDDAWCIRYNLPHFGIMSWWGNLVTVRLKPTYTEFVVFNEGGYIGVCTIKQKYDYLGDRP